VVSADRVPILVETAWLEDHLRDPDLRILDCTVWLPDYFEKSGTVIPESGRAAWEQGHIPGSAFADLVHDLSAPDKPTFMFPMPSAERFARAMSGLGVGDGTRVVLYDAFLSMWAARLWWMLRSFGFDRASVLNGGWSTWTKEGRLVSTDPPTYPAASFVARPRPGLIARKDEVLAAIDNPRTCLVNALTPDEFAGTGPVHYTRPGHIPSSVNVPFAGPAGVVDLETAAYRSPEELRALFEAAGASGRERVITYCGGGIAASNAAFALSLIGVDNVAVYDGSLTEWGADPNLPLETH
jgi:thiosulfate/3-mercaptopyruvate sulfurtransferase